MKLSYIDRVERSLVKIDIELCKCTDIIHKQLQNLFGIAIDIDEMPRVKKLKPGRPKKKSSRKSKY